MIENHDDDLQYIIVKCLILTMIFDCANYELNLNISIFILICLIKLKIFEILATNSDILILVWKYKVNDYTKFLKNISMKRVLCSK